MGGFVSKVSVPCHNCVEDLPWGQLSTFNKYKVLEGAFIVITNLRMDLRLKLYYPPCLPLDDKYSASPGLLGDSITHTAPINLVTAIPRPQTVHWSSRAVSSANLC